MSSCERWLWCCGLLGSALSVRSAWSWLKKSLRPVCQRACGSRQLRENVPIVIDVREVDGKKACERSVIYTRSREDRLPLDTFTARLVGRLVCSRGAHYHYPIYRAPQTQDRQWHVVKCGAQGERPKSARTRGDTILFCPLHIPCSLEFTFIPVTHLRSHSSNLLRSFSPTLGRLLIKRVEACYK